MLNTSANILDCIELYFYETVKYYDYRNYPRNLEHFGNWIGPSKNLLSSLCCKYLKWKKKIIDKSNVICITLREKKINKDKENIRGFDN